MSIGFNCEHCGKRVEAPDAAGGKRGRCPYCKLANYIPTPVSEDELYDLAPEDDQANRQAAAEREELRRQDQALLSEVDRDPSPQVPMEHREDVIPEDVYHHVVNYCLDLSQSNLERAQTHVAQLRKVRHVAVRAVDDFLSGKAIEPALDGIPGKLLQGFLMQMRGALA